MSFLRIGNIVRLVAGLCVFVALFGMISFAAVATLNLP